MAGAGSPVFSLVMDSNTVAELINVSIGYQGKSILEGISLSIERGTIIGVIGPNGGGKSTFVKTILGLIPTVSGSVRYPDGITFGYVPQSPLLDRIFPLSVAEIVTMGTYSYVPFLKNPGSEEMGKVRNAVEKVGIKHLMHRPFRLLSGGEKQRALLARAIVSEPDLMILDEPTASVDMEGESEIMSLIDEMKGSKKFTIIMVSHYVDSLIEHSENFTIIDKDRNFFLFGDKEEVLKSHVFRSISRQID